MLFRHTLGYGKYFSPDNGGGGGGGDDSDSSGDQDKDDNKDRRDADDEPLGDAGKRALQRERDRADAEETKRKDLEKRFSALEKKQRDADEAKAKEDGDYKKLLEDREKELNDLRAERATETVTRLKEKAARKHHLPDDLVAMITGDDEDTIETSAKTLAKHMKPADAPDIDANVKDKPGAKKSKDDAKYKDPSYWN